MLLRQVGQRSCVVWLASTGTIIQVGLRESMDYSRSALVTAIQPVKSRICWGEEEEGRLNDCMLEVEWPSRATTMMPPPIRFQRRTRTPGMPVQRMKRRRIDE